MSKLWQLALTACGSPLATYLCHRRDMDESVANQKIHLDRILTAAQGVWVTAVTNAEEVSD